MSCKSISNVQVNFCKLQYFIYNKNISLLYLLYNMNSIENNNNINDDNYQNNQEDIDNNLDNNSNNISSETNDLTNEIISWQIPELDNALQQIDAIPDISEKDKKWIKEYLKEWDFTWALNEAFTFIGNMLSSFLNFKKWWNILEEYGDILNNLESIDFVNMTKGTIETTIKALETKIKSNWNISKKLWLTYIISIFKEQLIKKDEPNIEKFELLKNNISPWSVLLLNKKPKEKENLKSKVWRLSLENYNDHQDVSFSHSVIVSSVDPTKIIHSTMKKFGENWNWVQEILLEDYLNSYDWVDILSLEMPQENKEKALVYAKTKLELWILYDDWVAVNELSGWYISNDDINKVNCVELIAEWLWEDKIKNISDPNDFLDSDILTPSYMTHI